MKKHTIAERLRFVIEHGVTVSYGTDKIENARAVDAKLLSDAANLLESLDYLVHSLYEEKLIREGKIEDENI